MVLTADEAPAKVTGANRDMSCLSGARSCALNDQVSRALCFRCASTAHVLAAGWVKSRVEGLMEEMIW